MKVIFEKLIDTINWYSIEPDKGIIITNNLTGIIYWQDGHPSFSINSNMDFPILESDNEEDFIVNLFKAYPNIEINYYPIE